MLASIADSVQSSLFIAKASGVGGRSYAVPIAVPITSLD